MSGRAPASTSACLSDAAVLALGSVPPDQIPAETARHLAACDRCQRRVLFGSRPQPRRRPRPPSLRRAFLPVGIVLVVLALLLVSVLKLAGLV